MIKENPLDYLCVISIDPSLNRTGLFADGESSVLCFDDKPTTLDKLEEIYDSILWLTEGSYDFALIEDYAYQASGRVITLGEVGGVIRLALRKAKVPFITIKPQTWKSVALGKAMPKSKKADRIALCDKVNDLYETSFSYDEIDEIDAYLIWQTARKCFELEESILTKEQLRIRNEIKELTL